MIQQVITKKDFMAEVESELNKLLKSAKEEYAEGLKLISLQLAEQHYKFMNATTEMDKSRAEANIAHLRATLSHISAAVNLDLVDRLITISATVITIAATAALKAII